MLRGFLQTRDERKGKTQDSIGCFKNEFSFHMYFARHAQNACLCLSVVSNFVIIKKVTCSDGRLIDPSSFYSAASLKSDQMD